MGVFITQNQGTIIGPIARLLGIIINALYNALSSIGIENIGLTIILFTLIVYLLMLPLTIRQQRFAKLNQRMSPELKAIQDKYKGRRDNASMMAQQEEMQAVYGKYGVSQMGSCLPLLIQLPILWAVYRVIYAVPAYVTRVKDLFLPLAKSLLGIAGSADFIQTLSGAASYRNQFSNDAFLPAVATNNYAVNTFIDVLNRSSSADWSALSAQYPSLQVESVHEKVAAVNNFLGLNISENPSFIIREAWSNGAYLLMIGAILVPVLSAATQWLNAKLMPQAATSGDPNDPQTQMANQMRSMNLMMPLFSAFICFSLPVGAGIYWIAGAVIRIIQQVVINKHIDRMDLDAMIEKNQEKYARKQEKRGTKTANMAQYAAMNTRNIAANANFTGSTNLSQDEKDAAVAKARAYYESGKARKGTLLEAANMVRAYEEKNNR